MNRLVQRKQILNSLPLTTGEVCVKHDVIFAFGLFPFVPNLTVLRKHPVFFFLRSKNLKSLNGFEIQSP